MPHHTVPWETQQLLLLKTVQYSHLLILLMCAISPNVFQAPFPEQGSLRQFIEAYSHILLSKGPGVCWVYLSETPFLPSSLLFYTFATSHFVTKNPTEPERQHEGRAEVDKEGVVQFMKAGACGQDSTHASHLMEQGDVLVLTRLSAFRPFFPLWGPDSWSSTILSQSGSWPFS